MGDGAVYALQGYIRRGMNYDPNYVPKKRPRIKCPECGKVIADIGLKDHLKMKHQIVLPFAELKQLGWKR